MEALNTAAQNNDWDAVAQLAHRLIPMLKQMEAYAIVDRLIPLEDKTLDLKAADRTVYLKTLTDQMNNLIEKLNIELD